VGASGVFLFAMSKNQLQVGDLIEVKLYELDGILVKEKWLLAKIVQLDPFGTKFLVEVFKTKKLIDIPGNSYMEHWR